MSKARVQNKKIQTQPKQAKLVHACSGSFPGPWLLSKEALGELDQLLVGARQEFQQRWTEERKKAESEKRYFNQDEPSCHVSLVLDSRDRIHSETFLESQAVPDASLKIPIGFELIVGWRYSNGFRIELKNEPDKLNLTVDPDGAYTSAMRFSQLETWANRHRPHPFLRIWREFSWGIRFLTFIYVLMAIFVFLGLREREWSAYEAEASRLDSEYQRELFQARETEFRKRSADLLVGGLRPEDQTAAISLLLEHESGLIKPTVSVARQTINRPVPDNWRFLRRTAMIFLPLVILCFPPGSVLGLGKGESVLRRRSVWVKVVLWGFPAAVATNILLPWLIQSW